MMISFCFTAFRCLQSFFWFACLGLFCVKTVAGTTYYVDIVEGVDTNSGTSIDLLWAHLPGTIGITTDISGWTVIRDGDRVIVKGGTVHYLQVKFTPEWYVGNPRFDSIQVISGHLVSPAWGDGRAIIDGDYKRTFGVWFSGRYPDEKLSGLTLDGFEVRNIAAGAAGRGFDDSDGSSCVLVGGAYPIEYFTLRNCWIHSALRDADDRGHGVEFSGSQHWIITKNRIGPNIGTKGCEPYDAGMGLYRKFFLVELETIALP